MIVKTDLRKKGRPGKLIADVEVVQVDAMRVRIMPGPVFVDGEDHTFTEPVDVDISQETSRRWAVIHLAKRLEDGACVVLVDEGVYGVPPRRGNEWPGYSLKYRLAMIDIPEGARSLDDASVVLRRWVDKTAEQEADNG